MSEIIDIIVSQVNDNVNIEVNNNEIIVNLVTITGAGFVNHSGLTLDDGTNPHSTTKIDIGLSNVDNTSDLLKPISTDTENALLNKADLVDGFVPASQLPSYVDDVLEFADLASFPAIGEISKIYIALDTNKTYRWSGSFYVVISDSLALGETAGSAYRGDRGKTAFDHSQDVTTNPHGVTKAQVGLSNVDNTSDADKPISLLNENALDLKVDKVTGSRLITSTESTLLENTSGINTGDQDLSPYITTLNANDYYTPKLLGSNYANGAYLYPPNSNIRTSLGIGNNIIGSFQINVPRSVTAGSVVTIDGFIMRWDNAAVPTSTRFKITTYVYRPSATPYKTVWIAQNSEWDNDYIPLNNLPILFGNSGYSDNITSPNTIGIIQFGNASTNWNAFEIDFLIEKITIQNQILNGFQLQGWSITRNTNNIGPMDTVSTVFTNEINTINQNLALKNNLISFLEFNDTNKTLWNNGNNNQIGNTSFGEFALESNVTGNYNTCIGAYSLQKIIGGSFNIGIGNESLSQIINGSFNIGIGTQAGTFDIFGNYNTSSASSIFIGKNTRTASGSNTNEIVIGDNAVGRGTNTTVIGTNPLTKTYLAGNTYVGRFAFIGTESTLLDASLSIVGNGVDATLRIYKNQSDVINGLPIFSIRETGRIGIGQTVSPDFKVEIRDFEATDYLVNSSTEFTPVLENSVALSLQNAENNNGGACYLQLGPRNSQNFTAYAYIGAVSVSSVYSPRLVFGMRTGSTSYEEKMRINVDGIGMFTLGNPSASAALQIDSTTKGFVPPRMTTAQKNLISSPLTGMVIYDTTLNKLCVRSTVAWQTITSV